MNELSSARFVCDFGAFLTSLSTPSSTKDVFCPFNAPDVLVAQPKLCPSHPPNARSIDISPPRPLFGLLPDLPLQYDAALLGLPAPLGLPGRRRGHHALANVHGHLVLLEDGRVGPEGLDAQVRGLLADAAGRESSGLGAGARRGGCQRGGGFGVQQVGFGDEAAELEVLG